MPHGPLGRRTAHVCIDMQAMFAERTDWHVPWMERVLPNVLRIAGVKTRQTIFTPSCLRPRQRMPAERGALIISVGVT